MAKFFVAAVFVLALVFGVIATPPRDGDKPVETQKVVVPEAPVQAPAEKTEEKPVVETPAAPETPVAAPEPVEPAKPVEAAEPVAAPEPVEPAKPVEAAPAEKTCSETSEAHIECLKNAKWNPSLLLECGQKLFKCLSGRLNVQEWW